MTDNNQKISMPAKLPCGCNNLYQYDQLAKYVFENNKCPCGNWKSFNVAQIVFDLTHIELMQKKKVLQFQEKNKKYAEQFNQEAGMKYSRLVRHYLKGRIKKEQFDYTVNVMLQYGKITPSQTYIRLSIEMILYSLELQERQKNKQSVTQKASIALQNAGIMFGGLINSTGDLGPNIQIKNLIQIQNQVGGTCYAHAIATCALFAQQSTNQYTFNKYLQEMVARYDVKGAALSQVGGWLVAKINKSWQKQLFCPKINICWKEISTDPESITKSLRQNIPVIISFGWTDGQLTFNSLRVKIQEVKYHATVIVGRKGKFWKIRNSWGKDAHEAGIFDLHIDSKILEAYVITKI